MRHMAKGIRWMLVVLLVCGVAARAAASEGAIPPVRTDLFSPGALRGWQEDLGYQYLLMGRYHQERVDEPILWRVLGVEDGRALLVSEVILEVLPFDNDSNEWKDSSIRKWLNETFWHKAFDSADRDAIVQQSRDLGSVFLLSRAELSNPDYGFLQDSNVEDPARSAGGTSYAYEQNLWRVENSETTNYYARSKANDTNVHLVTGSGKIMLGRIDRDNVGVRPAIWVDVARLPQTVGEGTLDNPFAY